MAHARPRIVLSLPLLLAFVATPAAAAEVTVDSGTQLQVMRGWEVVAWDGSGDGSGGNTTTHTGGGTDGSGGTSGTGGSLGDSAGSGGTDGSGADGGGDADGGGCGCRSSDTPTGPAMALLLALLGLRRRWN